MRLLASTLVLLLALPAYSQHEHPAGDVQQLGRVSFPVSCNEAARTQFERAVAMLHSFWYDEAARAFARVAEADSGCAMAYWGLAMSYYTPLWESSSPEVLRKGSAALEKARALGTSSEPERDYLEAIGRFYQDWEKLDHRTRALAYGQAMERLRERYPQDREAAIFHALSLLGTALPSDKSYANQRRAGAVLEKIFAEQPRHPGVAHYIIHAYDSPELAAKALDAARKYSRIAPSAPHALHMPSHIFTRLGLWGESIGSNRDSSAAARRHAARIHPEAASFEDLHALDYLEYAHLQAAQDVTARGIRDGLRLIKKVEPPNFAAAYALAAIPARYAVERRDWKEAAAIEAHPAFPWERYPAMEAVTAFVRALGAARSGNPAAARKEIEKLDSLRQMLAAAKQDYWAQQVETQRRAAAAWLARAEGKDDEAARLMRAAADLEDSTEKHPVTPGPIVPARELLGDLLLEMKKPAEALLEFEAALRASPNRYNALAGAARAAEASGDRAGARAFRKKLAALSAHAEGKRQ